MTVSRDNVSAGGTLPDDELLRLIVRAYQDDDLRVPLSAVTRRRPGPLARRTRLFAALATAGAAASVVTMVATTIGPQGSTVTPGGPPETTGKVIPTTTATVDDQRCADIHAQTYPDVPLPPLRFTLAAPDPRLRLLLFGDNQYLVACWLNHDRVDLGGNPTAVNPENGSFALAAYGIQVVDPAYVQDFAEYGFGRTPPGTTAVELRYATGDPVAATLVDGWWAWLGVGEQRTDEATELVITVPGDEIVNPIQHG